MIVLLSNQLHMMMMMMMMMKVLLLMMAMAMVKWELEQLGQNHLAFEWCSD